MSTLSATKSSKVNDYSLTPKDKAWVETKLRAYTALIGKSIDAETDFAAKEKEWLAAMKLGRQSARDRFKAGEILIAIQAKITNELGYPFWPWLKAMDVPEKTAQRAIELTKFYKSEDRLGDKTITECYVQIKAAKTKAKTKAKDAKNHKGDDAKAEVNGDDKLGKDTDTVSHPLPNFPKNEPKESHPDEGSSDGEHDLDQEENDEADMNYDQESLLWDLDEIEDLLRDQLKSMAGELGAFPEPEKVVKKIDACLDLLDQLKLQVPNGK